MDKPTEEDERDTFKALGQTQVVRRSLAVRRERKKRRQKAAENARTPIRRLFEAEEDWVMFRDEC